MKKIIKDKRFILLIVVVILVLLLLDFNQRMVLLTKMRGQEKQLATQYAELLATRAALETQIAFADSDQAVEKWAREDAGMVQPGDVPIVLLPASDAAIPTPTSSPPIIDKIQNWEIWKELFFGE